MKLFGGSKGARTGGAATRTAAKPAKHKLKPLAIVFPEQLHHQMAKHLYFHRHGNAQPSVACHCHYPR